MQDLTMLRTGPLLGRLGTAAALILAAPVAAQAQDIAPPYSFDEVRLMLQGPQSQERIGELVSAGCIEFEMDAFVILDLRAEGAGDALIDALNDACFAEPVPAQRSGQPPTVASATPEEEPTVVRAPATRRTLTGRGFYGRGRWLRFHYSKLDQTKSAGLTWAKMTSGAAEFALWGAGSQETVTGPATEELQFWDADIGMSLNLFLVQPSSGFPIGFHLGGLAGLARAWTDGAFDDGVNRYRYGWEVGAFGRVGTDAVSFVPRISRQWAKNKSTSDVLPDSWVVETIILGAEANLGGFVPGVFLHLADDTSRTVLAVTFAF